jgi:cytoskeletal protein CcmA (bactofilin family)
MAEKGEQLTVIGPDAVIKGEISFQGKARILGTVEGRIDSQGEVLIESGSNCRATVDAAVVVVDGVVEGDLTARERLQLSQRAAVKGDIAAGSLIVAEGATFIGHCSVGPEAIKRRVGMSTEHSSNGNGHVEVKRPVVKTRSDWMNDSAPVANGSGKPTWIADNKD